MTSPLIVPPQSPEAVIAQALVRAHRAGIDIGDVLASACRAAAGKVGDDLTAHRRGSWEAEHVRGLSAGWDDVAELIAATNAASTYREAVNRALATRKYFGEPLDDERGETDEADTLCDEGVSVEQAAIHFENRRQRDAEDAS